MGTLHSLREHNSSLVLVAARKDWPPATEDVHVKSLDLDLLCETARRRIGTLRNVHEGLRLLVDASRA